MASTGPIDNRLFVLILQHPQEKSKGSAAASAMPIRNSRFFPDSGLNREIPGNSAVEFPGSLTEIPRSSGIGN
jgi:hypothetical protein